MRWDWLRRRSVLQLLLLGLSGCIVLGLGWRLRGRASGPIASAPATAGLLAPVPNGPGPDAQQQPPVSLSLSPAEGAPGDQVRVELMIRDPGLLGQVRHESDGHPLPAMTCWEPCTEPFLWVGWGESRPGQFSGLLTLPRFLSGRLLQDERLTLDAVCLEPVTEGCVKRVAATATVQIHGPTQVTRWTDVRPGPWAELALFGRESAPDGWVTDPNHPGRAARCSGGPTRPENGQPGPQIESSLDGGKSWEATPLTASLGSMAGLSGCRAFALDPHDPGVYYVAGFGHIGASDWGMAPQPYVTRDSGKTWEEVPAPSGLHYPGALRGFTVSKSGVTAWYADVHQIIPPTTAELPTPFKGLFTPDGGRTWTEQPFSCTIPCSVVQETSYRTMLHPGMLRSADGGATWRWATWNGEVLHLARGAFMRRGEEILAPGACLSDYGSGGCVPLLRSTDGGQSWEWVQVPAPPKGWEREPWLWLEPDGSLRLRENVGTDQRQYRLAPGAATWTEVPDGQP